jgi:hypothetical protein
MAPFIEEALFAQEFAGNWLDFRDQINTFAICYNDTSECATSLYESWTIVPGAKQLALPRW